MCVSDRTTDAMKSRRVKAVPSVLTHVASHPRGGQQPPCPPVASTWHQRYSRRRRDQPLRQSISLRISGINTCISDTNHQHHKEPYHLQPSLSTRPLRSPSCGNFNAAAKTASVHCAGGKPFFKIRAGYPAQVKCNEAHRQTKRAAGHPRKGTTPALNTSGVNTRLSGRPPTP